MSHLRFTTEEYQCLAAVFGTLDLEGYEPHRLQRLLVVAFDDSLPALAARLARLQGSQVLLLANHFRRRPRVSPALTPAEGAELARAFGPLLFRARFRGPLRRALVRCLRDRAPGLAAKLYALSDRDFQALCEQLEQQARRGA
jgi:hypothetical protein